MKRGLSTLWAYVISICQNQFPNELLTHVPSGDLIFSNSSDQSWFIVWSNFRHPALWTLLPLRKQVDLDDHPATFTEARKVACVHEIGHATAD